MWLIPGFDDPYELHLLIACSLLARRKRGAWRDEMEPYFV